VTAAALPRPGAGDGHAHAAPLTEEAPHGASKRVVVAFGFWLFLISDIIVFACFFAAYAVLSGKTAGGPGPKELFEIELVALETACLLLSSFTCGLAGLGALAKRKGLFHGAMAATFVLGAVFVGIELHEFSTMVERGAGPSRSAFHSAFFALVGCHGLHVVAGLLWLLTMVAQVHFKGFRDDILRRILCFGLFWHTLDIVWVGLFSLVYLVGLAPTPT
jgi:cytochrome o ubiquinol oxidase subunit 3